MRLRTLGLTVAATLAFAGTASADSISFIRGGDIWVASPDGAKQVQITHSGGYSYQSQADDGTFVALAGRRLHRIDRNGTVLADFSAPVSGEKVDDDTSYFMGPFDPEISPDGTKVVYSYLWQYIYTKPGCVGYKWYCQEKHLYQGVGYSYADRMTGWDELGRQSGWVHPSWMGNDQVLLSRPSEPLNDSVMFDRVGTDNNDIQDWFSDGPSGALRDGELNRQGTTVAFVAGADEKRIVLYHRKGAPPAGVEQFCTHGGASGTFEGLSWSPSGDRLAFADRAADESGKVHVVDYAGGCNDK